MVPGEHYVTKDLKDGVNGVEGLDGAKDIVFSVDGNHAYITGSDDNAVSWYRQKREVQER